MLKLIVFDERLGIREGDDGRKLLASYPSDTPSSTRAIVGLAGGLIAYGSAWEGASGETDDGDDDNDGTETDGDDDSDDNGGVSASVPPLERGFAVHFERSRWVMHRDCDSRGVWWLLVSILDSERVKFGAGKKGGSIKRERNRLFSSSRNSPSPKKTQQQQRRKNTHKKLDCRRVVDRAVLSDGRLAAAGRSDGSSRVLAADRSRRTAPGEEEEKGSSSFF